MATYISTAVACQQTNVAQFVAWGQAISLGFAAVGWVQTADTGQVDWGTIAAVPAINTTVYEIWRAPSGALQTACPIYFKVEYGSGSATTTPLLRFSFGQGSNGSGTLTGTTTSTFTMFSATAGTANTASHYISGDANHLSCMFFRNNATTALIAGIMVERNRLSNGTPDSTYYTIVSIGVGTKGHQSIFASGAITAVTAVFPVVMFDGSGLINGGLFCSPAFPVVGKLDNPLIGCMSMKGTDITEGSTASITMYGTAHTYLASKAGAMNTFGSGSTNGTLILWE